MSLLTVKDIDVFYQDFHALKAISMTVSPHRIYGFLGQNGAGKTTLIHTILEYLKHDNGSIIFQDNLNFQNFSKNVGYVSDAPGFPEFLSASEYLLDVLKIYGLPQDLSRVNQTLERVGLEVSNKKIRSFSRGMRQKLAIAAAIIHHPQLLIMDEPTSALDPLSRRQILDLMVTLKKDMAILYSTHILEDAEKVCDDIGIIHEGTLRYQGNLKDLLARKESLIYVEAKSLKQLSKNTLSLINVVDKKENSYHIETRLDAPHLWNLLVNEGLEIKAFYPILITLEQRFKELISNVN
jgi:ABC-2 type transport system ATP-binding protein